MLNERFQFRVWTGKEMIYFKLGDNLPENWSYWDTCMQNTSLTDKNGKEIYEGDIVCKYYSGGDREDEVFMKDSVKWGTFNIGANGHEYDFHVVGPYLEDEYLYSEMIEGEVEVIGNIYENSNLLK